MLMMLASWARLTKKAQLMLMMLASSFRATCGTNVGPADAHDAGLLGAKWEKNAPS